MIATIRIWPTAFAIIALSMVLVVLAPAQAAYAAYCSGSYRGRDACQGYFTGDMSKLGGVDDLISGGTSAYGPKAFTDEIDAALTGGGGQDSVGAAFIIANSFGKDGTDFSSKANGQTWARNNFDEWKAIIFAYDAAGYINWSRLINTATAANMGGGAGEYRNSAWFGDIGDSAFHNKADEEIRVIEITTPSGGYFRLQRICLNLVGKLSNLNSLPSTINPQVFVNGENNNNVVVDASSGATSFEHRIKVTNYGGSEHKVSYKVQESVNTDETCNAPYTTIKDDTATVNSNADIVVWGPSDVAWDRSTTRRICQRLNITDRDGATIAGSNPQRRWATVRSGTITFGVTTDPLGIVEPGAAFSMDGSVRALPVAGNSFPMTYSITYTNSIPGISPPAARGGSVTVSALYTDNNPFSGTIPIGTPAGTKVCIKVEVTNPTQSRYFSSPDRSEELCIKVVNKPVFQVRGGDTVAGSSIDEGSCSSGPASMIGGWNINAAPFTGAGTTFAAYATDVIKGFATARDTNGVSAPSGLAFANTIKSGENYGGFFDRVPCMSNQWAVPSTIATITVPEIGNKPGSNVYALPSGNKTIGNITVNSGVQQVIYIAGDLTIDNNILYNRTSSWATRKSIPALKFVVSGNIIINGNVTQIDGVYAAKGSIDTCQYPIDATMYDGCKTKLVVNGALVSASKTGGINLKRTYGSVRTATPGNAAEEINYRSEVWMAQWPQVDGANTDFGKYDSITALPPVL